VSPPAIRSAERHRVVAGHDGVSKNAPVSGALVLLVMPGSRRQGNNQVRRDGDGGIGGKERDVKHAEHERNADKTAACGIQHQPEGNPSARM